MADFTYHDYLLHKVVQPYSIRGQSSENGNLKKNIPLYITRQAGKVREKFGKLDTKGIITKQIVQPPQVFLDSQFEKLQAQQEGYFIRKPGIDTNLGMNRIIKTIFQDDDLNGKDDPVIRNIKNRISNEKYVDDFFVLTEGARPRNTQKEEKLSVEKQIKTVLQEKVNEDQLKKLYRKYVLETMKKNITTEKKLKMFDKEHIVKIGSLKEIEQRKNSLNIEPQIKNPNHGRSASMITLNAMHSLVLPQNFFESDLKNQTKTMTMGTRLFGQESFNQIQKDQDQQGKENNNKLQTSKQLLTLNTRLSGLGNDLFKMQSKDQIGTPIDFLFKMAKLFYQQPEQGYLSPKNGIDTPKSINQEGEEDTYEAYQLSQLQKLQDVNKKQQQYKFNDKESEKNHIQNICNHFDLSIQKLLHLEDKKQLESNQMKKLIEITLESEGESEEENNFENIDENLDDSSIAEKNKSKDKLSIKGGSQMKSYHDKSQQQKLNEEVQNCVQRENEVLFERIKYENEENIVNEQDEKLIKSIINLENKQEIYQKYVQKKKRELQLQNLLNMKEMSMKKQYLNSLYSNSNNSPSEVKQKQSMNKSNKINAKSIQSFSNVKSQHELSQVTEDFIKSNTQLNLVKQRSYKLQNGKPVHENSVLSFLKSDYKLLDSPLPKSQYGPLVSKKMNIARLTQLAIPKYANQEYMSQVGTNGNFDGINASNTTGRQHFYNTGYNKTFRSTNQSKERQQKKAKSQQIDFYTTRKENKAEVDKMKLNFLQFFDDCFDKKHEFEEEKQKLRIEISELYCQNQQELTKLQNYTGPKLSTLSPQFNAFIEQKNFKKKLFNYLINSMEPKDRQMAIYLYKQDRQLDDL